MHLYGSTQKNAQTCTYGCCGLPLSSAMKDTSRGRAARKAAKKRARREGKDFSDQVDSSSL